MSVTTDAASPTLASALSAERSLRAQITTSWWSAATLHEAARDGAAADYPELLGMAQPGLDADLRAICGGKWMSG